MLVAEVGVVEAFVAVKQNVETLEPGFGFVMAASWAFEEVEDYWEWPTVQVALALEIEGVNNNTLSFIICEDQAYWQNPMETV